METARIWRGDGIRRICYGNYQHTVTGITIERNRDAATGNVVEITYEVPEEDALGTQPEMGSRTDLLGGVVLIKTTTTPGTAGIASVKLTYGKPEPTDDEDDGEEDSEDGSRDGSEEEEEESEEGSEQLKGFKSTLDVTVVDEPILTHPKCAGIAGDQLEYLKALIDGARMWELVPQVKPTDRVVASEHTWMAESRRATGMNPTTGWIAYRLLSGGVANAAETLYAHDYRDGRITLESTWEYDTLVVGE